MGGPAGARSGSSTAEEAASLPLRKEPARSGPLRLIDIEDFDLSACGGTHVAARADRHHRVAGWEKFRGGTRVEFLLRARALARFRYWRDALAATQRLLSVAPEELAAGDRAATGREQDAAATLRGFQEQLAAHEARALVARGEHVGGRLVVVEALDGWDAAGLKALAAAAAAATPGATMALFSTSRPPSWSSRGRRTAAVDAGAVVKTLVAAFGGKGGGKPDLAQGGGLNAPDRRARARRPRTTRRESIAEQPISR